MSEIHGNSGDSTGTKRTLAEASDPQPPAEEQPAEKKARVEEPEEGGENEPVEVEGELGGEGTEVAAEEPPLPSLEEMSEKISQTFINNVGMGFAEIISQEEMSIEALVNMIATCPNAMRDEIVEGCVDLMPDVDLDTTEEQDQAQLIEPPIGQGADAQPPRASMAVGTDAPDPNPDVDEEEKSAPKPAWKEPSDLLGCHVDIVRECFSETVQDWTVDPDAHTVDDGDVPALTSRDLSAIANVGGCLEKLYQRVFYLGPYASVNIGEDGAEDELIDDEFDEEEDFDDEEEEVEDEEMSAFVVDG